jgi:hypothetical protein
MRQVSLEVGDYLERDTVASISVSSQFSKWHHTYSLSVMVMT